MQRFKIAVGVGTCICLLMLSGPAASTSRADRPLQGGPEQKLRLSILPANQGYTRLYRGFRPGIHARRHVPIILVSYVPHNADGRREWTQRDALSLVREVVDKTPSTARPWLALMNTAKVIPAKRYLFQEFLGGQHVFPLDFDFADFDGAAIGHYFTKIHSPEDPWRHNLKMAMILQAVDVAKSHLENSRAAAAAWAGTTLMAVDSHAMAVAAWKAAVHEEAVALKRRAGEMERRELEALPNAAEAAIAVTRQRLKLASENLSLCAFEALCYRQDIAGVFAVVGNTTHADLLTPVMDRGPATSLTHEQIFQLLRTRSEDRSWAEHVLVSGNGN